MLPIVSILFALGIPTFALWKSRKEPMKRPYLASVASFIFCAAAAIRELAAIKARVTAGDMGGIEDTIGIVIALCIGLLVVTALLNLLLLRISYKTDA